MRRWSKAATASIGGTGGVGTVFQVTPVAPVITSALTATAIVGQPFRYQIANTSGATSYAASGLPAGLVLSSATGAITGTPTVEGTSQVTIHATNLSATGSAVLTLTVKTPTPPVINGSLNPPSRQGVAFAYQITATNTPTSFAASGLPAGLNFTASTGRINGTPTEAGTFQVAISATNASGMGTAVLDLVVKRSHRRSRVL